MAGVLAKDAFRNAVAHTYNLVLAFAFEVVVSGIVRASAAVAAGGRPPALGGRVVMADLVAPRALDQRRSCSRPDKLDAPSEHADPLTRRLLTGGVVRVQDGCDNRGGVGPEVSRVILPVGFGAEYDVIEAGIGPQRLLEFFWGVNDFRVPFDPRNINPPELDPSPARGGDYAGRFRRRKVAAE
jgi:hypothetical protein